jgi:hypothetical protein
MNSPLKGYDGRGLGCVFVRFRGERATLANDSVRYTLGEQAARLLDRVTSWSQWCRFRYVLPFPSPATRLAEDLIPPGLGDDFRRMTI